MWTLDIQGLEPIKVIEKIPLPFEDKDSVEEGSPNPIVNLYRYRFPTLEDFGCEVFVNQRKLFYYRFIVYRKDSNEIMNYGKHSIGFSRSNLRRVMSICTRKNPRYLDRITRDEWYKTTIGEKNELI